jgi:hypothetical protein
MIRLLPVCDSGMKKAPGSSPSALLVGTVLSGCCGLWIAPVWGNKKRDGVRFRPSRLCFLYYPGCPSAKTVNLPCVLGGIIIHTWGTPSPTDVAGSSRTASSSTCSSAVPYGRGREGGGMSVFVGDRAPGKRIAFSARSGGSLRPPLGNGVLDVPRLSYPAGHAGVKTRRVREGSTPVSMTRSGWPRR